MEIDENEILIQMAEIALHRGTYLDLKLLLPEISSIDDFDFLNISNKSNVNADGLEVVQEVDTSSSLSTVSYDSNLVANWKEKILQFFTHDLKEACEHGTTANPRDRRYLVASIANYMKELNDFKRSTAEKFASFIVKKYPNTFCDRIGNDNIGKGTGTLRDQIYNAADYRKNDKDRKRHFHESVHTDDRPHASRKHDEYGCVAYAPELPLGETKESQEIHRQKLKDLYNSLTFDDVTVPVLIRDTYATLRSAINVRKDRDLNKIFTDWPFLNEPSKLIDHATCLLGKPVSEIWQNSLTALAEKTKNYFKEMCISKNSTKGNQAQRKKKMSELLAEAKAEKKSSKSRTPYTIVIFPLLMVYFEENQDFFIKVIDVHASEEEIKEEAFPHPTAIIRGLSLYDPNAKYDVVIEQTIIINVPNVLQRILITFLCYYIFGYAYPQEITKTLEFIQRNFMKINPTKEKGPTSKRETGAKRRRIASCDILVIKLSAAIENFVSSF
ncbi:uncharacterized protein [Linepithema humile]|uniref:uncharacterized protein n=1 Tax=Linepithema humile TaxID=83485 RepID=UPI00351E2ABE